MKKYAIALAFAALPFATTAQALNYNYVEGGLVMYPDADGQDYTGFGVRASYELEQVDPKAFVYGGYSMVSDDADLTIMHFGAGVIPPFLTGFKSRVRPPWPVFVEG